MEENSSSKTVNECLNKLRQKLLDLSLRNNLLNYKINKRCIRIIDELPDVTFDKLVSKEILMTLLPMNSDVQQQLSIKSGEQHPEDYVISLIERSGGSAKSINTIESGLDSEFRSKYGKDCINTLLLMKKAGVIDIESDNIGLRIISKSGVVREKTSNDEMNNYALPNNGATKEKRHFDDRLQTPLTPNLLESRSSRMRLNAKTALEETGANFLYLCIGYLEWTQSKDSSITLRAPLILIPLEIERSKIRKKTDFFIYKVSYTGEDFLENVSLIEKMDIDFGIEMPMFDDDLKPEKYFEAVGEAISHKPGWHVVREMVIDTFSFSGIVMYRDLDNSRWPKDKSIAENDLIEAMCIGTDEVPSRTVPGESEEVENFEHKYPLILDADSSQLHAIHKVLEGRNYVIHGPPGTGKSQTISNLIACALFLGKSVLFVAEKKAALEVVKKRLDHVGLGDFCLELHSHKIKKGHVFQQLGKRLSRDFSFDPQSLTRKIEKLKDLKKKLSQYSSLMNQKLPNLDMTIHDIMWATEKYYKDGFDVIAQNLPNIHELASKDIDSNVDILSSITSIYSDLTREKVESWKWFRILSLMPGDDEKVRILISHLKVILASSIEKFKVFKSESNFPFNYTFEELKALSKTNNLIVQIDEYLLASSKFLRLLSPKYWRLRNALKKYLESLFNSDPIKLNKMMKAFKECSRKTGVNANTNDLLAFYKFIISMEASEALVSWCFESSSQDRLEILRDLGGFATENLTNFNKAEVDLSHYGTIIKSAYCTSNGDQSLKTLSAFIIRALESISALSRWTEYCQFSQKAEQRELSYYCNLLNNGKMSSDNLIDFYYYNVYLELIKVQIKKHPVLLEFSRIDHENARETFKVLDKEIIELRGKLIADKLSASSCPPKGQRGARVEDLTEMHLINHEVKKQRSHVSIRNLVKRAGRALETLTPCFMMSPMSVAQFLPPGYLHFDLVVMDEASQIFPEDAFGAIARADQMVVVGDPKQLPPTSFFDTNTFADGFVVTSSDSILDRADTSFSSSRLLWHYRSQHESLIQFSNKQFYDNELIIFPSPYADNPHYGVDCQYIEGATYLKGRNIIEAEAVVSKILEHYRSCPELSLGVVTFNMRQRDLIQDLLDKKIKNNPEFDELISGSNNELEPFFIKNLESVQGDERDVIMISTTFGPDPDTNRVFQRFGPIGGDFGWRRLNVMVTRAKMKIHLITSMKPDDIIADPSKSMGVIALRNYIKYAMEGRFDDTPIKTGKPPDSDFEISVINTLKSFGHKCEPQVGVAGYFIDIGVKHPKTNDFILGIECDGAMYHSAKLARDRDRLRQEILEAKGWRIHRIWSTDWFKNRTHEIERLNSVINDLRGNK